MDALSVALARSLRRYHTNIPAVLVGRHRYASCTHERRRRRTPSTAAATLNMSNEDDIEDLHRTAVLQGSATYIDPETGFTCFTELIHLRRGTCCGNKCRHCPFGWTNVPNKLVRRPAAVPCGDKDAVKARLQQLKQDQREYQLLRRLQQQQQSEAAAPTTTVDQKTTTKTGGRHGGRLTTKNVPYTRGGDTGMSSLLTGERRSKAHDVFEAMGTVDELCSIVGVVYAEYERGGKVSVSNPRLSSTCDSHLIASATVLKSMSSDEDDTNGCGEHGTNDKNMTRLESQTLFQEWLLEIMSRLFDVGSHIAKPRRNTSHENSSSSSGDEDEEPPVVFVADGIGGGFDDVHIQELEDWIDQMTDELPELHSFILPTGSVTAAQLHVARCVCRRAERRVIPLVDTGVCDPRALQYLNRLSDFLFTAARWVNHFGNKGDTTKEQREETQYRRPTQGAKQRMRFVAVRPLSDQKGA
jgi:cob(I)alamin adenosyltransferase